jgi:selenide,water dikinase
MGPEALAQVLRPIAELFTPANYPSLLRGLDPPDDAVVWKLDDDSALVHTADFFPPVVDDPYAFGAIAAANALSDVYAMGGRPLFAINLVGFPDDMDPAILSEILRGGGEKVKEAGAVVAGGHTTTDREPKFGLAVTGIVRPDRVLAKEGARAGDVLLLTKPLGAGIVTTAAKRQKASEADLSAAIDSMSRLSARAAALLQDAHPHEMAHLSKLTLRFRWEALPLLPNVESYARAGHLPGGGKRNAAHYAPFFTAARPLEDWQRDLLYDPQTSGPLLAAVDPAAADAIVGAFRAAGEPVWVVGEAVAGRAGGIEIV